MDNTTTKLLREKLRGYQIYNEWEQEEERRTLPQLSIQESVRQFLDLQRLMRQIAPDAQELFFLDNLAQHVEARARFMRVAEAMERPELVQRYKDLRKKARRRKERE